MTVIEKMSLGQRVMASFAWQGFGRISERMIRFGMNIILARILTTDDFGLFMALLAPIAAVETFTFLSSGPFIIQNDRGREPGLLRTVLFLNILRGLLLCAVLLSSASLVAEYFGRPEMRTLMMFMALLPLINAFMSPAIHVLEKELRFKPVALNGLVAAVVGTAVALSLAYHSPSVWVLILGKLAFALSSLIGSWIIAPMNPFRRPDLSMFGNFRRYAFGAFGIPVLIMAIGQAPAILIGRLDSMESLGVFALTYRLAELPVFLSLSVIGSVLIPAYSKLQDDVVKLRRVWLLAWSAIGLGTLPVALLVAWSGDALPVFVWGSSYTTNQPLVPVLALVGFLSATLSITGPLFWGVGKPGIDRRMQFVRVIIVYALGVPLAVSLGAFGVGCAMAIGLLGALVVGINGALRIVQSDLMTLVRNSIPFLGIGLLLILVLALIDLSFSPQGFDRLMWSGSIALCLLTIATCFIFFRPGGMKRFL
ncbi:MAG: hypothetical protein CMJ53_08575 [Planctomycetaceae bacterium]|nr:hypothetical protein [Planctomycetaceae bacterium]|tara:strand:+ start:633 stop:2075 length:1443 start_codon:yes stop_codon:yes gene_type:complete